MEERKYVMHLKGNETLARDLVSEKGQLILRAGFKLAYSDIVRIKQIGIIEVWVTKESPTPEVTAQPVQSVAKMQSVAPVAQIQSVAPVVPEAQVQPVASVTPIAPIASAAPLAPQIMNSYQNSVSHVKSLYKQAERGSVDIQNVHSTLHALVEQSGNNNFLHLLTHLRTQDAYTYQHSVGVGLLCRQIGEWMGLTPSECAGLLFGGTMLDIGTCKIDPAILNKSGRLSEDEFEQVKKHTTYGYEILLDSGVPESIAQIAYNHHERLDGSGYPRGLQEEEIDLFSKIAAVADVFHAMTSRRVYSEAVSYYRVLEELQSNAFGRLDPQIVLLFVQKMTNFFIGNKVVLSDGTTGMVILTSQAHPTRPLIQTEGGFLNLEEHRHLYIQQIVTV